MHSPVGHGVYGVFKQIVSSNLASPNTFPREAFEEFRSARHSAPLGERFQPDCFQARSQVPAGFGRIAAELMEKPDIERVVKAPGPRILRASGIAKSQTCRITLLPRVSSK